MRILYVEDDSAMVVELMLKAQGFNVYTTDLGEEAIDLGKIYDYDAIVLDLNLPDVSGLEVLRALRVGKIETPIIILTGDDRIETKIKALSGGADDYITKPFHKEELVARIQAVVRRSKGHAQSVIWAGNMQLNVAAKVVRVDDKPVHLTGREYQLLELLALRKGSTITKEMALNHLYGGIDEPEIKIIDVFICKIRKALRRAGAGEVLGTVWGRGYVLRDPGEIEPKPYPATFSGRREHEPLREVLLERLAAGCATFPELAGLLPDIEPFSVRANLSVLVQEGRVTREGAMGRSTYRLSGTGSGVPKVSAFVSGGAA